MPNCKTCNAPIFFLPIVNDELKPTGKTRPVNVDPDTEGTFVLVAIPVKCFRLGEPPDPDAKTYGRPIYGRPAREYLQREGRGVPFYRDHAETCKGWTKTKNWHR
jgi:hypothetical protein